MLAKIYPKKCVIIWATWLITFFTLFNLSETAQTSWFCKYLDSVQVLNSVTCGIFQIYFCNNLLNSDQNSKIESKTKLNKKRIETLLNELFVLDGEEQNEATTNEYTDNLNIKIVWLTCSRANNYLSIRYCWLWTGKTIW